jgi:hypothetical protein
MACASRRIECRVIERPWPTVLARPVLWSSFIALDIEDSRASLLPCSDAARAKRRSYGATARMSWYAASESV